MRICENIWHGVIKLEKFQECPLCHSEAYHLELVEGSFEFNKIMGKK